MEEATRFFDSGAIPRIHIRIPETNMVRLRANARAYVRATVRKETGSTKKSGSI
jgi:hypothetical protein